VARALLKEYKGTVVAVTHDRISSTTRRSGFSSSIRAPAFPEGNYSSWLDQSSSGSRRKKVESKRQKTLARELEWIRMSPRARQSKGKARLNAYEQLLNEDSARRSNRSKSTFRRDLASVTSSWNRAGCERRAISSSWMI
jgi:ATPase subunit of ABC transporter with duplicated ATPase domains